VARSFDERCPDCWHPHLHAASFRPLGGLAAHDQDPARLFCPVCHPVVGSAEFERYTERLQMAVEAMDKSRRARGV
jgi:hypothetical protein